MAAKGSKNSGKKQLVADGGTLANSLQINEPEIMYATRGPILVRRQKAPENQLSSFEKIAIIKEGISKNDLEYFKEKVALDYEELATVLAVTKATLINKKGNEKFSTGISEKILSVADLYAVGLDVFEEEAMLNNWLRKPNRALGGATPLSFLDNQFGRDEIRNLLGRIEYGVYS